MQHFAQNASCGSAGAHRPLLPVTWWVLPPPCSPLCSQNPNFPGAQRLHGATSNPPPALGAAQPSTQPQSWASPGAEISAPHLPALSCNDAEQNGNGEYRGGKLHLICFKSTEALIFWDVFLLYIFVNAKCSRCQIRLICKWKPILPSPPYSSWNENKSAFAAHRFPSSTHPSDCQLRKYEHKCHREGGIFLCCKKCCVRTLLHFAFLNRYCRGFGRNSTKLSARSAFPSSVKSQQPNVAPTNFILKAAQTRAIAAPKLNNSYYLPSFRQAAERQWINILKSVETRPSTRGEERCASREGEKHPCVRQTRCAARRSGLGSICPAVPAGNPPWAAAAHEAPSQQYKWTHLEPRPAADPKSSTWRYGTRCAPSTAQRCLGAGRSPASPPLLLTPRLSSVIWW